MKDIEIRKELHQNFFYAYKNDCDTKIINELGVCQGTVKIDVAIINGSLIGYEIKSEQDNLLRLPTQIENYNKVFDYLNIVINEKHLDQVIDLIPAYWGIIQIKKSTDGFIKCEVYREAQKNSCSDPYSVIQLLWRDECLNILHELNLLKGMKSKPRIEIWKKICQSVDADQVNDYVRKYIKARPPWKKLD